MLDPKDIFPIGMGTWGIGGFAERNPGNDDKKQIEALTHMFSEGINFFEVGLWAAEGKSAELVAKAIKESGVSRDKLFITEAIYTYNNPEFKTIDEENKRFLELFDTDYLDSMEFSHLAYSMYGKAKVLDYLKDKLANKKTRFVSLMNSPLTFLKEFHLRFKKNLFAHEVGFNFEIRENQDFGIIPYNTENKILNVIYQPLRRNRTALRNWPLLVKLSKKYKVTQNQIILSWIISKKFLPMTKSETKFHIDEHFQSIDLKLEKEDLEKIDTFRPNDWVTPKIDWDGKGDGVRIDQLSNVFDDTIDEKITSK